MAQQTRTTTKPQQQQQDSPQVAQNKGEIAMIAPPRLAYPAVAKEEFGTSLSEWRTLVEAIFPSAKTVEAVCMALAYCKSRKLDIYKRPVHIVPIWNSSLRKYVETVWPGINELRSTAMRTSNYAGMDVPLYGPTIKHPFAGGKVSDYNNGQRFWKEDPGITLEFPEWCQITVYRLLQGNRVPFPGPRVYWLETYAVRGPQTDNPNTMWERRSNGQLEKCAEAAALRRAFPEEIGDDYVPEEIGAFHTHNAMDVTDQGSATVGPAEPEPQRSDFEKKEPAGNTPPAEQRKETSPPSQSAGTGNNKPEADTGGTSATGKPPYDEKANGEASKREQAAAAGVTDVEDLNAPLEDGDMDEPSADAPADDWPPQWAREGQKLEFMIFPKVSEFVEFAEDFCDKTNKLGAEQFLAFYARVLLAMEGGSKPQKEAASLIRATCKEKIDPPASVKQ